MWLFCQANESAKEIFSIQLNVPKVSTSIKLKFSTALEKMGGVGWGSGSQNWAFQLVLKIHCISVTKVLLPQGAFLFDF